MKTSLWIEKHTQLDHQADARSQRGQQQPRLQEPPLDPLCSVQRTTPVLRDRTHFSTPPSATASFQFTGIHTEPVTSPPPLISHSLTPNWIRQLLVQISLSINYTSIYMKRNIRPKSMKELNEWNYEGERERG